MSMVEYHENAEKLAKAMKQRRLGELGLDQKDLFDRGGPSRAQVIRFEQGKITRDVRPSTLDKIDKALGWPRNHSAEILESVVPRVDSEPEEVVRESVPSEGIDLREVAQYAEFVNTMQQTVRNELQEIPEAVEKTMQDVTNATIKILLGLTRGGREGEG